MTWMDDAIEEGRAILESSNPSAAKSYVKRMVGVLAGPIDNPKIGLHMFSCNSSYTGERISEDVKTVLGKVTRLRDEQQRTSDEKFGTFALSEYIEKCDEMLADDVTEDEAKAFCYEVSGAYAETIPGYKDFLDFFVVGEPEPKRHIPLIRAKLKAHRDRVAQAANAAPQQTINTLANATSVATVDLSLAMSQMWSLPDSVLSTETKTELAQLLAELEESKKKDPSKVREAAKAVGNWLFDKAIEAVPAVMPFVTESIRSAIAS